MKRVNPDQQANMGASRRKVSSSVTQSTVASFFTPTSHRAPERITWQTRSPNNETTETLLIGKYVPSNTTTLDAEKKRLKIAGFDLDSTLISTITGNVFPKNADDWKWWDASVAPKLRKLYHDDGFRIAVFSNQAGLSLIPGVNLKSRLSDFKAKVSHVFNNLDIPICILAATEKDIFRKPSTGMWTELLNEVKAEEAEEISIEDSFFVGDAAGRLARKGKPKDHSCSDRNFAENIGIKFATPEEFFLGQKECPFVRTFEPSEYIRDVSPSQSESNFTKKNKLDIVLMCGSPGAGKSSWYWKNLEPLGYARINQDILRTQSACLKAASKSLDEGKPVAIDNTNANTEARSLWIKLAAKHEIPIRCVHLMTPVEVCMHNNVVRSMNDIMNPERRKMVPTIAFNTFSKRFQSPQLTEGFQDITEVAFKFQGSEIERKIWSQYSV